MDIVVKAVLDFVQKQEGMSQAIIAGGAVRDRAFNLQPKDYDIFIPMQKTAGKVIKELMSEFGQSANKKGEDYGINNMADVFAFEFEDKKFDLIFKKFANDDEFPEKVISEFDYGINMAYYNGLYIEDGNEYFKHDCQTYSMTLINLRSLSELPKAMQRYESFCTKIKHRMFFQAPCLKMTNKSVDKKSTKLKDYIIYDELVDDDRFIPMPMAEPRRVVNGWQLPEAGALPPLPPIPRNDRLDGIVNNGPAVIDGPMLRRALDVLERNDQPRVFDQNVINRRDEEILENLRAAEQLLNRINNEEGNI